MRRITIHEAPTGQPRPMLELRAPDALWALVHPDTLEDLHAHGATTALVGADTKGVHLVLRSGRVVDDAASAFASWSGAGWSSFEDAVRAVIEADADPSRILIWPGPGSVLSDAVSTLSFARRHERVGLLIDPVAWVTPAMAPDAADHLARFAAALAGCATIRGVVIRPFEPAGLSASAVGSILRTLAERAGAAIGHREHLSGL